MDIENLSDELLYKIDEAFKETFVGNYCFEEDELKIFYNIAKDTLEKPSRIKKNIYFKKRPDGYIRKIYEIQFLAIVDAAKRYEINKDDVDQFLAYISRELSINCYYFLKPLSPYYSIIANIRKYHSNLMVFETARGIEHRSTFCSHAFAPISSMYDFFSIVFEQLSNKKLIVRDANNNFEITGLGEIIMRVVNNNPNSNYQIKVGIKNLSVEHPEYFEALLRQVIVGMEKLKNTEEFDELKYLNCLLRDWWEKGKYSNFAIRKRLSKYNGYPKLYDYNFIDNNNLLNKRETDKKPKYILIKKRHDFEKFDSAKIADSTNSNIILGDKMTKEDNNGVVNINNSDIPEADKNCIELLINEYNSFKINPKRYKNGKDRYDLDGYLPFPLNYIFSFNMKQPDFYGVRFCDSWPKFVKKYPTYFNFKEVSQDRPGTHSHLKFAYFKPKEKFISRDFSKSVIDKN